MKRLAVLLLIILSPHALWCMGSDQELLAWGAEAPLSLASPTEPSTQTSLEALVFGVVAKDQFSELLLPANMTPAPEEPKTSGWQEKPAEESLAEEGNDDTSPPEPPRKKRRGRQLEVSAGRNLLYLNHPGGACACRFCDTKLSAIILRVYHEMSHLNATAIQCPYCNHANRRPRDMFAHVASQHPEEECYALCPPRDQKFYECTDAERHAQKEWEKHIQQMWYQQREQSSHDEETPVPTRPASPSHSSSSEPTESNTSDEVVTTYPKDAMPLRFLEDPHKRNECRFCSKTFPARANTLHHEMTHLNAAGFCCPLCDYQTIQKYAMINHIKSEHSGEPVVARCFYCNELLDLQDYSASHHMFEHWEQLLAERWEQQQSSGIPYTQTRMPSIAEEVKLKRRACEQRPRYSYAEDEETSSEDETTNSGDDSQDSYKPLIVKIRIPQTPAQPPSAPPQEKNLQTRKLPQRIRDIPGTKIYCNVCKKEINKKEYWNHLASHAKFKRYRCPQCDYSCVQKMNLDTHIEKKHGRQHVGWYRCGIEGCPNTTFMGSKELLKHTEEHWQQFLAQDPTFEERHF